MSVHVYTGFGPTDTWGPGSRGVVVEGGVQASRHNGQGNVIKNGLYNVNIYI
jgi:hypothetical protein